MTEQPVEISHATPLDELAAAGDRYRDAQRSLAWAVRSKEYADRVTKSADAELAEAKQRVEEATLRFAILAHEAVSQSTTL